MPYIIFDTFFVNYASACTFFIIDWFMRLFAYDIVHILIILMILFSVLCQYFIQFTKLFLLHFYLVFVLWLN